MFQQQSAKEKGKEARRRGVPIDAAGDQPLMQQAEWREGWEAQDRFERTKANIETGLESRPKPPTARSIFSE